MTELARVQRWWQSAALETLLDEAEQHGCGPWIPAAVARDETMGRCGCRAQAAMGALRALRTVGLADSSKTHEGTFWKATDAAMRAVILIPATKAEAEGRSSNAPTPPTTPSGTDEERRG
jgi:hypothetical protein